MSVSRPPGPKDPPIRRDGFSFDRLNVVWHRADDAPLRMLNEYKQMDDGSWLRLGECVVCGARCWSGIDERRQVHVVPDATQHTPEQQQNAPFPVECGAHDTGHCESGWNDCRLCRTPCTASVAKMRAERTR